MVHESEVDHLQTYMRDCRALPENLYLEYPS